MQIFGFSRCEHDETTSMTIPKGDLLRVEHSLECRYLSYFRTHTAGKWFSKIVNPPITTQVLKDVVLNLYSGEMMGIVGAPGSGKSALLQAIAGRFISGDIRGSIALDHHALTSSRFHKLGVFLSVDQSLIPSISVKATLRLQADLTLDSDVSQKQKEARIRMLLSDFELLPHAHMKVGDLSNSARRRVLIAVQLVRDPVLIIVDDPLKDLEPLPSYQLMHCLQSYVRRHNRMAIVSIRLPRSDIYQLLTRITILFLGETIYSGYTKQMPSYFRQIGFPCPNNENPAVYYSSLAMIDRETNERYLETQEQAVRLVESFKSEWDTVSAFRAGATDSPHSGSSSAGVALCYVGQPNVVSRLITLTRRIAAATRGRSLLFLVRLTLLPLCAMLVVTAGPPMSNVSQTPSLPQSLASSAFNLIAVTTLIANVLTAITFSIHRTVHYQETVAGAYNGILLPIAYLVAMLPGDIFTVFCSTAIFAWYCSWPLSLVGYLSFAGVFFAVFQWSQIQTLSLMIFVKRVCKTVAVSTTVSIIFLVLSCSLLRSYRTLMQYHELIYYATFATVYRYATSFVVFRIVKPLNHLNCSKSEVSNGNVGVTDSIIDPAFCRWSNGSEFLREMYDPESLVIDDRMHIATCYIAVACLTVFACVLYWTPKPNSLVKKFQFN